MSTSLESFHVDSVNKTIPRVLADLQYLNRYVDTLVAVGAGKAIAADFLSERATACMQYAIRLHHEIERIAEMAGSAARRSAAEADARFRSNYRGSMRNLMQQFEKLDASVQALRSLSSEKLNEPGRWGDASVGPEPVLRLLELLNTLLELWSLEKIKQKLSAGVD